MIRIFIVSFSLILALSGCRLFGRGPNVEQGPTILPSVRQSPIQGLTESIANSPITAPTSEEKVAEAIIVPAATPVPQPTAGKGSVTGLLTWGTEGSTSIAQSARLYLGPVLKDDQGITRLVSIDLEKDPTTTTDEFGRFAFTNIEPGVYGLIYVVPELKQTLLAEHGTENNIMITIEVDTVTQLGQLTAKFPF